MRASVPADGLLFNRVAGESRDQLDQFWTPPPLAAIITAWLSRQIDPPRTILEPSVGGGALARAARATWPGARVVGVDLDPAAAGFRDVDLPIVGDWLSVPEIEADLVLGNPPFSGVVAIPHVTRALRAAPAVALVLPWAPLGGIEEWHDVLVARPPAVVAPIVPRPWPRHVRETALYVWVRGRNGRTEIAHLPRWRRQDGSSAATRKRNAVAASASA